MPDYVQLARVVCVATGKGGVSKTSLTANAAGLAAAAGHRTLLIDLDPQGDLSDDLGYFNHPALDEGRHLANAMLSGTPLQTVITNVRANLDVIPGGEHLSDVSGALLARQARGRASFDLLAECLAPLAGDYDLIFIDTPPTDDTLQLLALSASRWLLIPTKADTSSIRAIQRIAARVAEARSADHALDILGVVLVGVPTAATRVRSAAEQDIHQLLGDVAPLFDRGIRDSAAVARETRSQGVLVHELAEKVEGAEPFWKSLRSGTTPSQRLPGSAPALADDYVRVTEQILLRIDELENAATGAA
ncbi:ParA family protein [Nocardioides sp. ChNu-99]|uniref:ParA family protein n=1 Tax=Nocardioides sp. ChNu-99 TaxID=2839897 RepID=UPI0024068B34|nr:ParA family protein [Nocardioides sp. ChNu-99]MDF9716457.1 ParA family protein [Nocardioides sp. ChNu-99]